MQVGVSTASLFMRRDNEGAISLFKKMGISLSEVFLTTFSQYTHAYGERLSRIKGEMKVNSVHVLTSQYEPQLFSRHPLVKTDAYEMLGGVMSAAQALGASYYSFHGTTRAKRASRSGERDNFPAMIEDFRRLIDFCGKFGVTPCLENVEWSTYNRPGVFSELKKGIPDLKGVLDIKQARISGHAYSVYLEEMGESIAYVHLSDITPEGKMCLPGKGSLDFAEILKRLIDVGFDGALLIEAYEKDYVEEEELKISCEYLQELLYKYGKQ